MTGATRSNRALLWTGVAVLCVWTLLPIYILALGALGGREIVSQWPKPFAPFGATFAALKTFLAIEGVRRAAWVSIKAAAMTMVMALALGIPAGYALARFRFRGAGEGIARGNAERERHHHGHRGGLDADPGLSLIHI